MCHLCLSIHYAVSVCCPLFCDVTDITIGCPLVQLTAMPFAGLRSAPVRAKRMSTGHPAPLPGKCPLMQAWRPPARRIAQNGAGYRIFSCSDADILSYLFCDCHLFSAAGPSDCRISPDSPALRRACCQSFEISSHASSSNFLSP